MSTMVLTRYKSFPWRDSPHQGLVGATVAGRIVAQGPVGVPQGLDRRGLAGLVHVHAPESGGGGLDFPPKGLVVLGIADGGRDPADDDGRNLGLEIGGDGEGKHRHVHGPSIKMYKFVLGPGFSDISGRYDLYLVVSPLNLLLLVREAQIPAVELAARHLNGGIETMPVALAGQFPVGPVPWLRNQSHFPFLIDDSDIEGRFSFRIGRGHPGLSTPYRFPAESTPSRPCGN